MGYGKIENSTLTNIKDSIKEFLKDQYQRKAAKERELDRLKTMMKWLDELRARILNEGAHYSYTPFYEIELTGAIKLIEDFQNDFYGSPKKMILRIDRK